MFPCTVTAFLESCFWTSRQASFVINFVVGNRLIIFRMTLPIFNSVRMKSPSHNIVTIHTVSNGRVMEWVPINLAESDINPLSCVFQPPYRPIDLDALVAWQGSQQQEISDDGMGKMFLYHSQFYIRVCGCFRDKNYLYARLRGMTDNKTAAAHLLCIKQSAKFAQVVENSAFLAFLMRTAPPSSPGRTPFG